MKTSGHVYGWLLASVLMLSSCAAPTLTRNAIPWFDDATAIAPDFDDTTLDQDAENGDNAQHGDAQQSGPRAQSSLADANDIEPAIAEAALIRETAIKQGLSPSKAEHYHAIIARADPQYRPLLTRMIYADLYRDAAGSEDGQEPIELHSSESLGANGPGTAGKSDPQHSDDVLATTTVANVLGTDKTGNRSPDQRTESGQRRGPASNVLGHVPASAHAQRGQSDLSVPSQADIEHRIAERLKRVMIASRNTPSSVEDLLVTASMSGQTQAEEVGSAENKMGQETGPSYPPLPGSGGELAPVDLPWQKQLMQVTESLHEELQSKTMDDQDRARLQACLSLLHLAAEDPDRAVETLEGFDDEQLEFWRQTVMGLGILLDPDGPPKFRHRVDYATGHFHQGIASLASLGPLRLTNLALCTKVNGFGDIVECDSYALRPGKPVLLYVEVENYSVKQVEGGTPLGDQSSKSSRRGAKAATAAPKFETELHGRYEILDENQRVVVSRTLPIDKDLCLNRRRDYFIPYMLYLPEQIEPGYYTLELLIEDRTGGKFGNGTINFRIR